MTYVAIALFCALFCAVSASHKERRAWLWAILGGLIPFSLLVMGFNKCFRCEGTERQNQVAHFFISVGSLALFVGALVYESGIVFRDHEREHYRISSETPRNPSERYQAEKILMLTFINAERERVGVPPVKLGNNEAAQLHAEAMRDDCFVSHWDRSGTKPYMRYSLRGGYQVNAENVAGLYYCSKYDFYEDVETVLEEQVMGFMESEGHRETMLDPHFRKVSIGIAVDRSVWVVQHFEGEYVEFEDMPSVENGVLSMSGRALEGVRLDEDTLVVVEYDPPLKDISLGGLARTRCYGPGLPVAEVIQNPFLDYDLGDPEVRETVNEILASIEEENPIVHSECLIRDNDFCRSRQ